ncbi:MAG: Flp family type IVb pilin [Acetobacteraceae bacterium]|nr:Flp family type IVb pilin [Acetobacteraceae bacterium]
MILIKYAFSLKALCADRRGLTALEYGLIGSALFGAVFTGFPVLANNLSTGFSGIGTSL